MEGILRENIRLFVWEYTYELFHFLLFCDIIKSGLISESFSDFLFRCLGYGFGTFFGDWSKNEKLSEIKPPYLPYLIFTLPERALVLNKRLNVKEFQTVFAFTEKPNPLESRDLQPILKYFTHFHFD